MGIITSGIPLALKMFARKIKISINGFKQYPGSAEEICEQVVKDCWNGKYFAGSAGHFSQFWLRDFCFSAEALAYLGYEKEVRQTLDWALGVYEKHNKITTTIFENEKPVNIFSESAESLPYIINTSKRFAPDLLKKYKKFLSLKINNYYIEFIDHKTGLIRQDIDFSGMKDAFKRKSACVDNCMVAMMASDLKKIRNLPNPFSEYDYEKLIKENFWTGKFFKDDLSGDDYLAGDANVIPFSTETIKDTGTLEQCIKAIQENELDKPFPLKYAVDYIEWKQRTLSNVFTSNYEGDTIWMNIGVLYIAQVAKANKQLARKYLKNYTRLIESHKNYLELFNPNGSVYKTLFYHADEGMIWAAIYLKLKKDLKA